MGIKPRTQAVLPARFLLGSIRQDEKTENVTGFTVIKVISKVNSSFPRCLICLMLLLLFKVSDKDELKFNSIE